MSSSVVSLGKLAMSCILHTAGGLQSAILGAEGSGGGPIRVRPASTPCVSRGAPAGPSV